MIWFHCGLLGHTLKRCKRITCELCKKCFKIHSIDEFCMTKCVNCNGPHASLNNKCPAIRTEIEVLKIKERLDITYFDARDLIKNDDISFIFLNFLQSNRSNWLNPKYVHILLSMEV